jgi:hypothetical protein
MKRSTYVDDWDRQALAAYIADYVMEEQGRGNTDVDSYMIRDAVDAYFGGAADDADYSGVSK